MRKMHLRDPRLPQMAIHYDVNIQAWQLTDDPKQVTCGRCRRMMERREKREVKLDSSRIL